MSLLNQKKGFNTPSYTQASSVPANMDQQVSLIGKTLLVKGEVISDDEVIIEGRIEGKINVKNRVVIGKNGLIHADIEAREVVIKGKVYGNIKSSFRVEIVPEGALYGNIFASKVVIADGALFEGNIDMKLKQQAEPAEPKAAEQKPAEQKPEENLPAGKKDSHSQTPYKK